MKRSTIITIIVFLIVLVACSLFFILRKKETKETPKEKVKEVLIDSYIDKKEKKLTDETIIERIKKIDKKINYGILILNTRGENKYDEKDKLEAIAEYAITTHSEEIPREKINEALDCTCEDTIYKMYRAKKSEAMEEFKDVFGYEMEKVTGPNYGLAIIINGYNYEESMKYSEYFNKWSTKQDMEGETSHTVEAKRLNERYTEDENHYYLYFNASITLGEYTYHGRDEAYNKNNHAENKKVKMTEENANNFSVIKVIYKKDGDNIYFENLKILKDY